MNEFVEFVRMPPSRTGGLGLPGRKVLMRNSLILIGLTFRTFSAVVALNCLPPLVHAAVPMRSPLKAAGSEVTLKVAVALAPGAIGSANVVGPEAAAAHPFGAEMLNLTPAAGAPVVFVNVTVVSCEEPGENVWSPGGVAVADAGARLTSATSYLAAATLACTSWSVASVGKVPAAVIAPS